MFQVDFDQWLVSGLEAELAVKDSNYRIVRRRVAVLLGQWSGVKLSPALRPKLYQVRMKCGWFQRRDLLLGAQTVYASHGRHPIWRARNASYVITKVGWCQY